MRHSCRQGTSAQGPLPSVGLFPSGTYHFVPAAVSSPACATELDTMPSVLSRSIQQVQATCRAHGATLSVLLALAVTGCAHAAEPELRPFASDGCTWAPDLDFRHCCVVHDFAYWQGGTSQARCVADQEFRRCISEKRTGLDFIYYWAVRAAGLPHLPTSFRWGFGWRERRPFGPLNAKESAQVDEMTRRFVMTHREKCRNDKAESCTLLHDLDGTLANVMDKGHPDRARPSNGTGLGARSNQRQQSGHDDGE